MIGACRTPETKSRGEASGGIQVPGPGVAPQLGFACCEHSIEEMQSLFSQAGLIENLKDLHATVAIPILDFSSQRADVVRLLNRQEIPVVAWILMPKTQGYYLTADNAPAAVARFAEFNEWTRNYSLRWRAVGLDVEPNVAELSQLRGHWSRIATTLLRRGLDVSRIRRASQTYSSLMDQIRSHGYPVQIYQMPYIAAERRTLSSLPHRLLGTIDLRGDEEYLMLYTSSARPIGAGMIWSLGSQAWGITIGSTDGDAVPGTGSGPLDWDEFARDLIVASHFTRHIGIYDLEGCVRQGFLPRLIPFDWSKSVTIPAESVQRAKRLGFIARSSLWIISNLIYLLLAGILLVIWLSWRCVSATRQR